MTCPQSCVVYVDQAAPAAGDGQSAPTAFRSVQEGLEAAATAAGTCCTCEVRVAAGTYSAFTSAPDDSFRLRQRVRLVGGFSAGFIGSRDPVNNLTILDGRRAGLPVDAGVPGLDESSAPTRSR